MNVGEITRKGQQLIHKTNQSSTTHRFAKIWVLECRAGHQYGSNNCDAHIRRCPVCDPTAARGEPI